MTGWIMEIRPVQNKKTRYRICLDDGADFILYRKEVGRYDLEVGQELTEEKYEEILRVVFVPRAKKRAMHLLEQMDRTEAELREKLKQAGYPMDAIDIAIEYVRSYHYIDDERYARNYVRAHQRNKSERRIVQDLKGKGISETLIEIALEEENETDPLDQIMELLKKKKYNFFEEDYELQQKELARCYRFFASRGYEMNQIREGIERYKASLTLDR